MHVDRICIVPGDAALCARAVIQNTRHLIFSNSTVRIGEFVINLQLEAENYLSFRSLLYWRLRSRCGALLVEASAGV